MRGRYDAFFTSEVLATRSTDVGLCTQLRQSDLLELQTELPPYIITRSVDTTATTTSIDHTHRSAHQKLFTPTMPATTAETLQLVNRTVSVAPLVLLSAADHYGRSAKGTRKRVVGVLLGQNDGKSVRVSNSFAGMMRGGNRWSNRS